MGQPTSFNTISERTNPEWEAKCRFTPQMNPNGPASRVAVTLRQFSHQKDAFVMAGVGMTPDEAREHARNLKAAADEAEDYDRRRDASEPNSIVPATTTPGPL